MTTDKVTAPGGGVPPPSNDPDAIRADIEVTRAQLGDSVEALAAKADVKARVKEKVAEEKERAREVVEAAGEQVKDAADAVRRRPAPVAGVLAALAAAVGAVVMFRRRRAAKTPVRKRFGRR
jgi:Protein of unknown function (DUF3618)